MFPKLAAVVVGAGAIGIGGVAFTKPEWLGINRETPWTHLAKDHDYKTKSTSSGQDYHDKFGSKHKYYLVGVVGTKSEANTENTNKAMWEELFKKWKDDHTNATNKSSLGKGFKDNDIVGGVKPGNNGNGKYLNTVCQEVYKSDTNSITETESDSNYKESLVWKYCSGLGEKPKTIEDTDKNNKKYQAQGSNTNPIGKDATNRKKLVSTTGNDKFWEIRDKEFKGIDGYEKIDGTTVDAFFKQSPNTKTTIRELCEKAYTSKENSGAASTDTEPKKDKVIKYCSLSKE